MNPYGFNGRGPEHEAWGRFFWGSVKTVFVLTIAWLVYALNN